MGHPRMDANEREWRGRGRPGPRHNDAGDRPPFPSQPAEPAWPGSIRVHSRSFVDQSPRERNREWPRRAAKGRSEADSRMGGPIPTCHHPEPAWPGSIRVHSRSFVDQSPRERNREWPLMDANGRSEADSRMGVTHSHPPSSGTCLAEIYSRPLACIRGSITPGTEPRMAANGREWGRAAASA